MTKKLIKIAHSPDSDDAFMFYALKHGKVTSDKYEFEIERRDIEELNHAAKDEIYDITAISIHAYAYLQHHYILTASGASMAEKDYGPMVVSKEPCSVADLENKTVAVPGEWTTAFLLLKIIQPNIQHRVIRFDKIIPAIMQGEVDAGLLIHEGQLQYEEQGLHKVLSLIDHWKEVAGELPLPLGGNAIKKSLDSQTRQDLADLQEQSIRYAMNHAEEARDYAMQFKRDLTAAEADKYLSWYANDRTLDMGEDGRVAIQTLFDLANELNLIDHKVNLEII
jgi:1,4-dihydroxy-6-naphthoate synthase